MKIKYIPLTIVKILHKRTLKKKTSSTTIYILYSIKVIEFDFAPIIYFFYFNTKRKTKIIPRGIICACVIELLFKWTRIYKHGETGRETQALKSTKKKLD